jgi:glycine cleavage system transcriptional repressor
MAVGLDRPGIVAALTGVLVEQGCNLEDTEMAVLRGHFAMMLVVTAPDGLAPEALEQALVEATAHLDLGVTVRSLAHGSEAAQHRSRGALWSVAVYGADRPGIVHPVVSFLADLRINIVGMETRVIGEASSPVYAMSLDVEVPPAADGEEVARRLTALGDELGVACSMRPHDADIL